MMRKIFYFVTTLSLGSFLLASSGCSSEKREALPAPETVRDVQSAVVQRTSVPAYYEAVGTVRPIQSAQVAAQTMGNIVRMNVREGDRVSKGQVLAIIDDSQTKAGLDRAIAGQNAAQQEIAAANAEYALAESTLKRYQVLYDRKSVSPHEFDEVKTRYEAAKARKELALAGDAGAEAAVSQARTSLGYTQVRAPFSGTVIAKMAETGNLAAPGAPLYTLEDVSMFRLEATVDESGMGTVRLGESVAVTLDAIGGKSFTGKVVEIVPAADPVSRSFVVKVQLPKDSAIRSGVFGRAGFPVGTREGLPIPNTAVVKRGSMQAVYVLGPDEIASLRYVTLGTRADNTVEVLSGLESGERIVTNPGDRELNGKRAGVR
jgi:RND family efflux transporter MFP subunit